ncbi:hypothetical protein ARMGADRAFT_606414 [Armillaria gallica]|uniref:Uncharacterized protein n=1 Tax=Armillaria gallica TaxID=47427 RepID=A0A2H3D0Q9_ARMGA|nr:hypothetical protein ARMGADRAFT_606414 [Armillaria gallica]
MSSNEVTFGSLELLSILSSAYHFTFPGNGSAGQHPSSPRLSAETQSRCLQSAAPFLFLLSNVSSWTYFERLLCPPKTLTSFSHPTPSHRQPLEYSHDSLVNAAVSQPLPIPTVQEAMQQIFVVADFDSAQLIDTRSHEEISPLSLCPPEIIIDGS